MNYSQSAELPTEFRLTVACCRWAFASGVEDPIRDFAAKVDWERLIAVARRHRVEGLVWHSLERLDVTLPAPIRDQLSERARAIADHGLRAAAESGRLLRSFERAGVALIFIKGLTLGKLAYPSPFLKMSWDVDVLVAPDAIARAASLLEAMGYACVVPGRTTDQKALVAWHRRRKESVWVSADKRLHLELHGRLPDNPRLITTIGIDSPRQLVEVAPGIALPTLARDELFAYLCVHGASSGWHRLKWISDLAGLLDGLDRTELSRLYAVSQMLGAGRAAGQGLLLANELFGIGIGDDLKRQLVGDRETLWLVGIAMGLMAGRADQKDPTEIRFGTAMIHVSQLLLVSGWSSRWRELRRKIGNIVRNAAHRTRAGNKD